MTVELTPGRHVESIEHCWQGAHAVAAVTWSGYKWNKLGWEFRLHDVTLVKYYTIFTSCRVSLCAWIAQSV